jgi:GT2 family glycosyltransferase
MWLSNSKDAQIDVFVVTHNHAPWIEKCVDSVIHQESSNFNVFVYDDHSTKQIRYPVMHGKALCMDRSEPPRAPLYRLQQRNIPVRISHENLGTVAARMVASSMGCAPYMLFVDGDDFLDPKFLLRSFRTLSISQADVAYPKIAIVTEAGAAPHGAVNQPDQFDARMLLQTNYIPVTSLIRRAAFTEVGGFDRDFVDGFEDWALWVSMVSAGCKFVPEPQAVLYYRHHAMARSHKANESLAKYVDMLRTKNPGLYASYSPTVEEVVE